MKTALFMNTERFFDSLFKESIIKSGLNNDIEAFKQAQLIRSAMEAKEAKRREMEISELQLKNESIRQVILHKYFYTSYLLSQLILSTKTCTLLRKKLSNYNWLTIEELILCFG